MLSTKKMGKKEKFNILDIKIEIKGLKLLGEEKQLVPLTDMDIRDFKDLMGKTNLRDRERRIFNDAAEKIASVFSIYDDVLNEYLSKGEFNRRQLKKLIGKKYWEKIVEAYRTQHGVDLDKLDELDRRKILSTRREHMNYAENAILCLLDVDDFSNNTNYNDGIRIASLAKFDDRYFERPEVKQLLERDQRLFTEVLEYYPTAHEIAELNHKYTYVSHFISLFDYYRALPKIADAELYLQGLMQGDEQPPLHSITDTSFEGSPLGLEHLPMSGSPLRQGLYPAAQLEFMTPLYAGKSRQSMGSNRLQHSSGQRRSDYTGTPLNGNNDSFLGSQYSMLGPEEEFAFEEQQARRNARAWVLPNIVSPNRVTDQKKLSQLQQYFIDFLLSYDHRNNEYVDNGYLNMFILDACLLDEDIDEDSFEENVHKNSAFDFLTQNRELLLKMLNLLPDAKVAHDVNLVF